ncbi:MAG: hypothetical protein ABSG70_14665 [Terriglobales bacterium]|jgi:hypothetical protein
MPRLVSILWLLVLSPIACAQTSPAAAGEAGQSLRVVMFTLDFPESQPEHYSIRVAGEGPSLYESSGRLSADSDDKDSFDFNFTLSDETRSKIFALAAKAGYFQKDLESHHKGMAFTGKKTLSYKDAQRAGESTYNYSSNAAAQELTSLLQNLSATLEFGHRLDYYRRYQKLALDEELKRMQEMAKDNLLVEMSAIHPILEQIAADQAVVNIARARAQRLMDGVGGR